ncbi:MAG: SpoVR family protein [Ignavibacteria bacterium]|nr:SpoVR family protein [Ignavibacteria bacterium]
MQLIDQHTKRIMEGCKERARDAGLVFDAETLEYYVTNVDMLELSPKNMIPTLYDYWLQDIQVLHGKGEYEIYPSNPYETVINTRPVISFYNDNNPDWLNVMIFYHVLGHIDFFQNNKFFEKTWDYDFKEKALTEKRMIAKLRTQKGRKVDYVIEFAKGIDNLVGYFQDLNSTTDVPIGSLLPDKIDFYFNHFLQNIRLAGQRELLQEIDIYNHLEDTADKSKHDLLLKKVLIRNPEFEELYKVYSEKKKVPYRDLMQFVMEESNFLNTDENKWMNGVIDIIRDTSLYFSPMIRTKIMNEGWASYWHEKLFMNDERIKGHEVGFSRINANVTAISRVGLNPYAIGWRLFTYIEEMAEKGAYSYEFQKLTDTEQRKLYNQQTGTGKDFIFAVRKNFLDSTFISQFLDQSFMDKHNLFVVGQRINPQRHTREYYVKSRKLKDYKEMISDSLYHPPHIEFQTKPDGSLYLNHIFENKELYREYIPNTLVGLEYLWGHPVYLETTELDLEEMKKRQSKMDSATTAIPQTIEPVFHRVIYSVKERKVTKQKAA